MSDYDRFSNPFAGNSPRRGPHVGQRIRVAFPLTIEEAHASGDPAPSDAYRDARIVKVKTNSIVVIWESGRHEGELATLTKSRGGGYSMRDEPAVILAGS